MCAEFIFIHFLKSRKTNKRNKDLGVLGRINAAFIALIFCALQHALLDWRTGTRSPGPVFNFANNAGTLPQLRTIFGTGFGWNVPVRESILSARESIQAARVLIQSARGQADMIRHIFSL